MTKTRKWSNKFYNIVDLPATVLYAIYVKRRRWNKKFNPANTHRSVPDGLSIPNHSHLARQIGHKGTLTRSIQLVTLINH